MLGIPTVLDRFIQQAVPGGTDSPSSTQRSASPSYGFRPGRSAHQALMAARQHVEDG